MPDPTRSDEPAPNPAQDLDGWISRLVVDEAARARARQHWLTRQAAEEGTFAGVLTDLAERRRPLVLQLRNGRAHRGTVATIGADFAALTLDDGRALLVRLGAIVAIRTAPGEALTTGDRIVRGDLTFAEALAALLDERARVALVSDTGSDAVVGLLTAVGRDVATVRLDGDGGRAYVALASVAETSVAESG